MQAHTLGEQPLPTNGFSEKMKIFKLFFRFENILHVESLIFLFISFLVIVVRTIITT